MSESPTTILLEPARGTSVVREKLAGGAITPGDLLEQSTSDTFVVHNSAGVNAQRIFALENLANGGTISDAYASGDTVRALYAQPGDLVYALVADGATAITQGAALESAGDGTLRIATTDAATDDTQRDAVVAYAAEAVDNSGGGAEARIKVEVA